MGLEREIEFYESREKDFLANHKYDWILISGQKVIGYYKTLNDAGQSLSENYNGAPILMRQIGMDTPASPRVQFTTL